MIDVDKYLNDLIAEQKQKQLDFKRLKNELNVLHEKIQTTHKFLDICEGKSLSSPISNTFAQTIREALRDFARANNNILDVTKARQSLINDGILRDSRHASSSMSPILCRSPEFVKTKERGFYKFIDPSKKG